MDPPGIMQRMATLTGSALAAGLKERLASRVVLQSHQIPPWRKDPSITNHGFVMLTGRGGGKSFAAMWDLHTHLSETPNLRARVIAPTLGDGIAAAVDGPNGLLKLSNGQARWLPSAPGGACVRYPNGSRAWILGTPTEKDVDRLRALTNIDYDCIAAGTLVQTKRGPVPIEDVTTSDLVLTRAGYRRVLRAWRKARDREVFRVTTQDGRSVVGTGDHRVWTENRGWTPLQFLTSGDILVTSSADLSSGRPGTTATVERVTSMSSLVPGPAPRNSRTGTVENRKTTPQWGTPSGPIGLRNLIAKAGVWIAGMTSRTDHNERSSGADLASATEHENVKTSAVVSVEPAGTAEVWDISVEGDHEFFAGGILVHNCFEELFANPCAQSAFDQAALSRRRGPMRWFVSSTPRPHQLIKDWEKDPKVTIRRGKSTDNKHIPLDWLATLEKTYKGTRLYRQEVLGEVIEDVEGALWKANDLERSRVAGPASAVAMVCDRVVVGVDPPTGNGTCGIVVVGQDANGHMYVLDDRSVEESSPHEWAARVKSAADTYDAVVIAEINQGGQMVKEVLNAGGHDLPIHTVNATKSKKTRAEPIALLWEVEEQIVHMVTTSQKLWDELCEWVPNESPSPDRLDALVWACWFLRSRHTATVRGVVRTETGPVGLPSALSSVRMGRY